MSRGLRDGHNAILQYADALNLGFHQIAALEKLRRIAGKADSRGGPGGDQRTWQEGHANRQLGYDLGHRKDHVSRVAFLLDYAVDPQLQVQILGIGDLIAGDDARPDRTEAIETLPLEILAAPAELDVACREIIHH